MSERDGPRYDVAALEQLREFGGSELTDELIVLFALHAPERVTAARAAWEARDAPGVADVLHSLKSSSAQLGGIHMSRLCLDGELIARGGDLASLSRVLDALEDELSGCLAWMAAATTE